MHICCRAKAEIVSADEKESVKELSLNLGHTFGHAIENFATGYGKLLHGEAVATGMVMAADLSRRLEGRFRVQPQKFEMRWKMSSVFSHSPCLN